MNPLGLHDEVTDLVDEGRAVDVAGFSTVSHHIITDKLTECGLKLIGSEVGLKAG